MLQRKLEQRANIDCSLFTYSLEPQCNNLAVSVSVSVSIPFPSCQIPSRCPSIHTVTSPKDVHSSQIYQYLLYRKHCSSILIHIMFVALPKEQPNIGRTKLVIHIEGDSSTKAAQPSFPRVQCLNERDCHSGSSTPLPFPFPFPFPLPFQPPLLSHPSVEVRRHGRDFLAAGDQGFFHLVAVFVH